MYKASRILVPVDFSDVARAAISMAVQLADRHGAELIFLHVDAGLEKQIESEILYSPESHDSEASILSQETMLKEAVDLEVSRAAENGPALKLGRVRTIISGGDPVGVALQTIDAEGVDLVVMGTHGPQGLKGMILGSTAEQLVKRAGCSVFVVKPTGLPYLRD